MAARAGIAAVLGLSGALAAQPLPLDVRAVDASPGFDWGYHTGLKQPLGTVLHGRGAHQISHRTSGRDGSPDSLVWFNDTLGAAYVWEPTGLSGGAVNPGGMAVFHSSPVRPEDEDRLWLVYGARAHDMPFDLHRANARVGPFGWEAQLEDFVTSQGSSTPCIHVVGDRLVHAYRNGSSSGSSTTVRVQQFDVSGPAPVLLSELDAAQGMQHPQWGKVGVEQLWTRRDPRHGLLLLTWQWYRIDEHKFGSNPVILSRDLGHTWTDAAGTVQSLPLRFEDMTPTLMPYDHLSAGEHTGWYIRDLGLGPQGTPWITLPAGDIAAAGGWWVVFHRWDGSAWSEQPLTGGMHPLSKAHACGATRDYLVFVYSEEASRDRLLLRYSRDEGATWEAPVEIDAIPDGPDGEKRTVCWVSFFQPAESYPDNTARVLVGYYRDGEANGRSFRNRLRYLRVRLGLRSDLDADGDADTLDVLRFLGWFGESAPGADFNDNGAIDTTDFLDFLNAWASERGG